MIDGAGEPAIRVFYDGECGSCRGWKERFERRDPEGRVLWIDFTPPGFDPSPWGLETLAMARRIHGVLADGTVVRGVEVLRRVLGILGWRATASVMAWPGIRGPLAWAYDRKARRRLRRGRACANC